MRNHKRVNNGGSIKKLVVSCFCNFIYFILLFFVTFSYLTHFIRKTGQWSVCAIKKIEENEPLTKSLTKLWIHALKKWIEGSRRINHYS